MIKRSRLPRRKVSSKDSGQLTQLAISLAQSCCRVEDRFWEIRLTQLVDHLLKDGDEDTLTQALDQLFSKDDSAYGGLIDLIESGAESTHSDVTTRTDIVLIAVPILAWSRYQIPSGKVPTAHLATIRVHLEAHVLAKDTRLSLLDMMLSPDQLPQTYVATRELVEKFASPALHNKNLPIDPRNLPETAHFLSDTRYLIGAIANTEGQPLFRWQEDDSTREDAFRQWQIQGHEVLRGLLPACAFELLPPGAYHAAIRDADRASRPYSVKAAIDFLKTITGRPAENLQVTIGGCYNRQLEEYRVGFSFSDTLDVLHGIVWPLLDSTDDESDTPAQIEALIRESGINKINMLTQQFPMEYCDDCGVPLFPNPDGEAVHAELPEDIGDNHPQQLH